MSNNNIKGFLQFYFEVFKACSIITTYLFYHSTTVITIIALGEITFQSDSRMQNYPSNWCVRFFFFFPFFAWKLLPSFGKGLLLLWQLEKVDKTVNLNPMWEIWPRNTSMVFTFFNWLEQLYLYSLLCSNKCNYREHWKYSHVQSGSYATKKELVTWYFKILSDCM